MPIVEFSQREILRSRVVEPAWYLVHIDSVGQKNSADGGSVNYIMEGTIINNADTGDTSEAGVPTPAGWNFNSKAIGFAIPFLEALGVEIKPGVRVELKNAEGKDIEIFFEKGEWQGRIVSKINHKYRKVGAGRKE